MSATQLLRLRVAVNERDMHEGKPTYSCLIEYLQSKGIAGATVCRSIEGFGASGILRDERAIDATSSLTLVIESIDEAGRLTPLLDDLQRMMCSGLITVEPVEIHAPLV